MSEENNIKIEKKSETLLGVYIDKFDNEVFFNECFYSIREQSKPVDVVFFYNKNNISDDDIKKIKSIIDKPTIEVKTQDENGEQKSESRVASSELNYIVHPVNLDNFPKLFNKVFDVADKNGYELFSIMEKEDVISLNWHDIMTRFVSEVSDGDIFMPIIRNTINGVFNGHMNEIAWVEGMTEKAGVFDMDLLLKYNCAQPLGSVYKVSSLKEEDDDDEDVCIMKESMKISHYHEFFLRSVYNDLKVISVPRMLYELRITKKEEFDHNSCKVPQNLIELPEEKGGMSKEEAQFWMELAQKEYFFDEDREKTYSEQKQEEEKESSNT